MGKSYCKKENKWLFANILCPKANEINCRENCPMHKLAPARKLLKRWYKLYGIIEPLLYEIFWKYGIDLSTGQIVSDDSLKLTRRLWSLPENLGHQCHQAYLVKFKALPWWKKITRKQRENRNLELFDECLIYYEKLAKSKYKHYKGGLWHIKNKPLWRELKKEGYKCGLYG